MGVQTITTPTGEEMVVMSRAEYDALIAQINEAFEDGADLAAYDAALANAKPEEILPPTVTNAILRGMGRVRAYREWRKLDIAEIAQVTGITEDTLRSIEDGETLLSRDVAARLAEALAVPTGWLAV